MAERSDPSDEELTRRVLAGDGDAAGVRFDRHAAALRAGVRAHLPAALRGKVGESDVVQAAWLAGYMSLGKFEDRGEGSFGAWLRRIVERELVDEVRRHAELAELASLFRRAAAGEGRVVLLEGEAGIGKSRLVDEFVGQLAHAGEDVDFLYGS